MARIEIAYEQEDTPSGVVPIDQAARLPAPGDNAAIAFKRTEAGTKIKLESGVICTLAHTILEGHRFANQKIKAGDAVTSWGLPFGFALRDIEPGEYIVNEFIIEALAGRQVDFALPSSGNFTEEGVYVPYELDESAFRAGKQVEPYPVQATWQGFKRAARRGWGTRNFVVVVGLTADAASFARSVAAVIGTREAKSPGCGELPETVDGVVAVAHTEMGRPDNPPECTEMLLRTLAGALPPFTASIAVVLTLRSGSFAVLALTVRVLLQQVSWFIQMSGRASSWTRRAKAGSGHRI